MAQPAKRPPRPFEDVWLEISEKAREYQKAKRPIVTLKFGYKNLITGVTATEIERMSERAQNKENPASPSRREFEGIWNTLARHGAADHKDLESKGYGLYFCWALMKTFLRGLRFVPKPFRLEIVDWNQLMTPYAVQKGREEEFRKKARDGRPFLGGRGGGESDEHKALKQGIFDDPMKYLGEPMTPIKIEKPFITGDELDVLLQDRQGRYVCVEVEVDVGPGDTIGFHQAGKYRTLTAMEHGLKVEEVRAMVAARTIDSGLAKKFRSYEIEHRVCQIPRASTKKVPNGRPRACPKCKSDKVTPIVYGYPSPETEKEAAKGEVTIGGCVVDGANPAWHCGACGHEWS